jgi:hypothetical protein
MQLRAKSLEGENHSLRTKWETALTTREQERMEAQRLKHSFQKELKNILWDLMEKRKLEKQIEAMANEMTDKNRQLQAAHSAVREMKLRESLGFSRRESSSSMSVNHASSNQGVAGYLWATPTPSGQAKKDALVNDKVPCFPMCHQNPCQ